VLKKPIHVESVMPVGCADGIIPTLGTLTAEAMDSTAQTSFTTCGSGSGTAEIICGFVADTVKVTQSGVMALAGIGIMADCSCRSDKIIFTPPKSLSVVFDRYHSFLYHNFFSIPGHSDSTNLPAACGWPIGKYCQFT